MRRSFAVLALAAAAAVLSSCSDLSETLLPDVPEEAGSGTQGPAGDIFDATAEGGNPFFFYLNPFTKSKLKPNQFGTFDPTLDPAVTICPWSSWDFGAESCTQGPARAEYSSVPDSYGDAVELVLSAKKYQVVYKSQNYPLVSGVNYRVAVSIYGQALGWADMALYDPTNPAHATGPGTFTADDILLLNGTENQNISFRIDEGALEAEFCNADGQGVEDCDVVIVDPTQGAILRVFDDGSTNNTPLGALVDIPAGIYGPGDVPYTQPFPAVLELEFNYNPQPSNFVGGIPVDRQVPYFVDFWSPVEGLYFPQEGENPPGANIVLCQEVVPQDGGIPEYLHDFLVIFLVQTDPSGPTTTLLPTIPGAEECEGFDPHLHAAAQNNNQGGLLSRVAAGLSRVSRFFLPDPLFAKRRLHGGLNTVVWEISSDDGEGPPAPPSVSGLAIAGEEPVLLQFGAVLNVDSDATSAAVTYPEEGVVGQASTVTIQVLDALNLPFLFEVGVTVNVTGANTASVGAVYDPVEMVYTASYTPDNPGQDEIRVTLEQEPYLPQTTIGPFNSAIKPVAASAANTTFEVSYSEAGASTTVTVTVKDDNGDLYLDGAAFPIQVAVNVASGGTEIYNLTAEDDDGSGTFDGIYVASFTPDTFGEFAVSVLIGGVATDDSPQTITTAPRPADAGQSEIQVGDGMVESVTPVAVLVRNTAGEVYDDTYGAAVRPITVEVTVSGENSATFQATDPEGDGTYEGSYTPTNPGTDYIDAVITDIATGNTGSVAQATSQVAPLSGPFTVQIVIAGPAAEFDYGLPVELYDGSGGPVRTVLSDETGLATFDNVPYGFQHSVRLPKRDFDVHFPGGYEQSVAFDQNSSPPTVTFSGTSQALPSSVRVWRIGYDDLGNFGGSGNAFEYTVGGRSWTAADNQVREYFLRDGSGQDKDGHLATITSFEENEFIYSFYYVFDNLCPGVTNPKQCKYKGWIGLYDRGENDYAWVTGDPEPYDASGFTGWPGGILPNDPKNNQNYVEINSSGAWSITNGASTTNEGFFTEWDAWQPFGG